MTIEFNLCDFYFLHFRLIESRLLQVCEYKLPSVSCFFWYILSVVFFIIVCWIFPYKVNVYWAMFIPVFFDIITLGWMIIMNYRFRIDKPLFCLICNIVAIESLRIGYIHQIFLILQIDEIFQLYLYEEKMREGKGMILISKNNSIYLKVWIYKLNKSRLVMCKSLMTRSLWRDC